MKTISFKLGLSWLFFVCLMNFASAEKLYIGSCSSSQAPEGRPSYVKWCYSSDDNITLFTSLGNTDHWSVDKKNHNLTHAKLEFWRIKREGVQLYRIYIYRHDSFNGKTPLTWRIEYIDEDDDIKNGTCTLNEEIENAGVNCENKIILDERYTRKQTLEEMLDD